MDVVVAAVTLVVAVVLLGIVVLASLRAHRRSSIAARRAAILHRQRVTDQAINATVTTAIQAMLQSAQDRR